MSKSLDVKSKFSFKDDFSGGFSKMMKKAEGSLSSAETKFGRFSNFMSASEQNFKNVAKTSGLIGLGIIAPLGLAAKAAVDFEDKMSDIGKTTGLQGDDLKDFGSSILDMSKKTRSSIDDLSTIAEIGGRLGISGSKNLSKFTESANEFAVALGGDFSGGVESAITQFGKVTSLFKDTKDLDISEALKKSGSAMNALSAKGVNVEGLTDFTLRIGSLSDAIKPSLAQTTALGAVLQKAGLSSEIASSGFKSFLNKAGTDLPSFAKQMNISTKEAENLFNTDSAKFFVDFAASMKGVKADEMSKKLKNLKLNSNEIQGVIGILASKQGDYNKMLEVSNDQMSKGTSITEEYNTKNNNTAGQMAQLKNNLKATAITIGNALLPIISDLMKEVKPIIDKFSTWVSENKELVKTGVKVALVVAGIMFAVSAFSTVLLTISKVLKIVQMAQIAWNIAMSLNPIGLIVIAIAALVAGIVWAISNFESFGASMLFLMGPVGMIVNAFVMLKHYWDSIVEAFQTDGIIGGLKRIGVFLVDLVLYPVQQLLDLISNIPGLSDLAGGGRDAINELRKSMGAVDIGGELSTEDVKKEAPAQQKNKSEVFLNVNNEGKNTRKDISGGVFNMEILPKIN